MRRPLQSPGPGRSKGWEPRPATAAGLGSPWAMLALQNWRGPAKAAFGHLGNALSHVFKAGQHGLDAVELGVFSGYFGRLVVCILEKVCS